ncbi:MAG: FHA domain-containing protein [Pseudomonadota bacterium]
MSAVDSTVHGGVGTRVLRTTSLYTVAAWCAALGAPELLPSFGLEGDVYVRWIALGAAASVPIVALSAWCWERAWHRTCAGPAPSPAQSPTIAMEPTVATIGKAAISMQWRGELHHFDQDLVIGRAPSCSLHLDDPQISRRHAAIEYRRGRWVLKDLGSRNGTRLDGQLIDGQVVLGAKGRIDFYEGGVPLVVHTGLGGATTVSDSTD